MIQRPASSSLVEVGGSLPAAYPAEHATLFLVIAGLCLLLALRLLAGAFAPIGPLVRAVSAAVMAALAIGVALVLLVAAVFGGGVS